MPFVHTWLFFGGAAAASVPVIIHLLNRTRFRVIEWGAMRFIRESMRKNRRRVQLEELLLLALRCLAVFLLAVAVGRFMGCSERAMPLVGTARQMTHVFILDDSVSMGQKLADSSSFRRAAGDLAEMLQNLSDGDRVGVLLTSRPRTSEAVFGMDSLKNAADLGERIRGLPLSDTRGRLEGALDAAIEWFEKADTDKRLHILSDFRRDDYADADRAANLRTKLKAATKGGADIVLLNYGAEPAANLTIDQVRVVDDLTIVGAEIRVQVRVRNNGPAAAQNVAVAFTVRDEDETEARLPVQPIASIEPGQTRVVQGVCELGRAGYASVQAEVPGDSLAGDNGGYLALHIRQARQVLIVDGEPNLSDPQYNESHELLAAVVPRDDGSYGSLARVISPDGLGEENLHPYELVVLANVADLPAQSASGAGATPLKALEDYVRSGGGLLIFTGDRLNPTFYNGPLYDGGTGLSPLKILPPVADRTRRRFVRLLRGSIANDPVMRCYQGKLSEFTQFVRFYGYTPAEAAPPAVSGDLGAVRILARFDNQDNNPVQSPAIAVRSYGKGRVMMICSAADTEWSDWPKDYTYTPFIQDVIAYLSRPGGQDAAETVGEPIRFPLGAGLIAAKARMQAPRTDVPIPLAASGGAAERVLTYPDTSSAGIYRLLLTLPDEKRTALFARNIDPAEGRLERADERKLREWLGVEFAYRDRLAPTAAAAAASDQSEYWKAALAAMLVVLAAEVFLGQRFGHYR